MRFIIFRKKATEKQFALTAAVFFAKYISFSVFVVRRMEKIGEKQARNRKVSRLKWYDADFGKVRNLNSESEIGKKIGQKGEAKMGAGRPRKVSFAKNRRLTVILDEKAFFVFTDMCRKRGDAKWIHNYVSNAIIRDFETNPKFYLINRARELEVERDEVNNQFAVEMQFIAQQIHAVKESDERKKLEAEVKKSIDHQS